MGCLMGCFLPLGLSCGLFPTWHNQGRGSSISSTGKTQKGNVYPQKRKVRSVLRPSGPPSQSLPGYLSMTRSITTPPPPLKNFIKLPLEFADTNFYSGVERETVSVQCFAQEHATLTRPGLEPRHLDLQKFSALTIRQLRLPYPQNDYLLNHF